jgi:hypothetical protein
MEGTVRGGFESHTRLHMLNNDAVLDIKDVMSIAGISKATALRWVKGELPTGTPKLSAVRVGRKWKILQSELTKAMSPTELASRA